MCKLSIITINRNNASGLRKTIESVVSQTYTDFEYIIIDGASTDDSVDVIKEYAEATLPCGEGLGERLYWISEPDKGIYNAMNKGIVKAQGEYLLFLNSGDYLANADVLKTIFVNHQPEADIIGANVLFTASEIHAERLLKSPEQLRASRLMIDYLPHQGCFLRRDLFTDIHLYDETFIYISDWAFFLESILIHGASYEHLDTVVSLCDSTGISSQPDNVSQMEKERVRFLKEKLPLFSDDYHELENARKFFSSRQYQRFRQVEQSLFFKLYFKVRNKLKRL